MSDGWIEVDGQPVSDRPEGFEDGASVALTAEGIAVRRRGRLAEASWEQVFGVEVVGDAAYVLVPRRPPRSPWFRITADMLPPSLREGGVTGLRDRIRERRAQTGYRSAPRTAAPLSKRALWARVEAWEPVPGALEVPAGGGPQAGRTMLRKAMEVAAAFVVGGAFSAYASFFVAGLATLVVTDGPAGEAFAGLWVLSTLLGTVAVAGFVAYRSFGRGTVVFRGGRPRRLRVLVLAPDGCVCGLPEGVRTFAWPEIASFDVASPPGTGGGRLAIRGADGRLLGELDGSWFGAPLPLIRAVAEAYRTRVGAR